MEVADLLRAVLGDISPASFDDVVQHRSSSSTQAPLPLFPNLQSATTFLRLARACGFVDGESTAGIEDHISLADFFEKVLPETEADIKQYLKGPNPYVPYVVAVEGLDGSGKSSLVQALADGAKIPMRATRTPPASLNTVRAAFDRAPGPVTRAFYMVSNYVCMSEMVQECREAGENLVFVVDRFYSSTFAYTAGEAAAACEGNWTVQPHQLDWPADLLRASLVMFLAVPDHIRAERIRARRERTGAVASADNPWDNLLEGGGRLSDQIARHIGFLDVPFVRLNAECGKEEVLTEALEKVEAHRAAGGLTGVIEGTNHGAGGLGSERCALEILAANAAKFGLCESSSGLAFVKGANKVVGGGGVDEETRTEAISAASSRGLLPARRCKHALFNIQIAVNGQSGSEPPSLRTVGIHTVDECGIVFHSKGPYPGGFAGRALSRDPAVSFIIYFGCYPFEEQWRGEGVIEPCEDPGRFPAPSNLAKWVGKEDLMCFRLTPSRMEVLTGGPSTAGGPRRFEFREPLTARAFGDISRPMELFRTHPSVHLTIAVFGSHCVGKSTVCKALGRALQKNASAWDRELGEILRSDDSAKSVDQHRLGYQSCEAGSFSSSWDDYLFEEERRRDLKTMEASTARREARIVETWHIGNFAWAAWRCTDAQQREVYLSRAIANVLNYLQAAEAVPGRRLLLVHLIASEGTVIERKRPIRETHIPMGEDWEEKTVDLNDKLHMFCESAVSRVLEQEHPRVEFLRVVNDGSCETVVEKIMKKINKVEK